MNIKENFERILKEQASKESNKLITSERSNLTRSYHAGGKQDSQLTIPLHRLVVCLKNQL